jgi:hypothetical protein
MLTLCLSVTLIEGSVVNWGDISTANDVIISVIYCERGFSETMLCKMICKHTLNGIRNPNIATGIYLSLS